MRKIYLLLVMIVACFSVYGQPWIYDFGTGTGSYNTASGSSTSFLTSTPLNGGAYRVRAASTGNQGTGFVLANPGTTLGTGTELQINASVTASTNKFGIYDWASPSTVAYMKCKFRTTSSGNGNIYIGVGVNTAVTDNLGYTSQFNNSLSLINITYASGAISSVVRRINGGTVVISGHGLSKDVDQIIEIYANNGSGSVNYDKSGTNTLATRTWDLWVDGVKVVNNGATAGTLVAGTSLSGIVFLGESSTGNAAFMYIDDIEYSNSLPSIPTPTTTSISPSSATAGGSGFTLTVNGTNFVNGVSTVKWNGANKTTTFVNSTQLTASIDAADIASAGSATVTVLNTGNPTESNGQTFTINPAGAATKLAITSVSPSSPTANSSFSVTVQAQDNSNIPQNVGSNVTVNLSRTAGTGNLGGTLSGTINAGSNSVTFTGLTYDVAESGVELTAADGAATLTSGTATFTVLPAASQLAFVGVPATGTPGVNLSSFTVEARRPDNSVDNTYTGNITISKSGGPGTLSGTTTVAAVAGVATFSTLQFDQAGTHTLDASASGLTGATSGNIVITQPPVTWNFGTAGGNAAPSGGTPVTNLTIGNISIGNTNGTVTMLSTTSASSGYSGVSGSYNAGNATIDGAFNSSTSSYFEFTLTPAATYRVTLNSISFGTRSTGSGPTGYTIRTSLDSYAASIGSGSISNNSVWSLITPSLTPTSSLSGTPITFRIYGFGGSGASANTINWRIDDLSISFNITLAPPTITSFTPTSGYRGTTVVLTGTDLTGATSVTFGGTNATSFVVDNSTQITAVVAAGNTGVVSVTNANGTGSSASNFTYTGYISVASGNWSNGATWLGGVVPGSSDDVTIDNGHTVTADVSVTRDFGTTTTINSSGVLTTNQTFTSNGTMTVNGSFQINEGGWATGTGVWTYGSAGTLIFNNSSGSYGVNSDIFWPSTNGPVNVTVQNTGGITMNVARTVTGLFQTAAGVLNGNNLALNGTAQLNTGGYFTNAPIYGPSSLLRYNTGGTYNRGDEWNATGVGTIGTTNGYPNNVQVSNNTTINLPNGSGVDRACERDLIIDNGSSLYADYGGGSVKLYVGRNFDMSGNVSLGSNVGGDLYVRGNFTRNAGTFNPNGRTVFFDGASGDQTITGATTFDWITINKAAGNVLLANSISCNYTLTLTNGKIVLGNNDLTINDGADYSISGGSATSYIVTNGTGMLRRLVGVGYAGTDFDFPVGSAANRQLVKLNFNSLSSSNTVSARFITGSPVGTAGLPLSESGNTIQRAANNGYWEITNSAFTGDLYTGTFYATGFTDITDYTKVHLIKRADAVSNWVLDGTHVTTTGTNLAAVLQRTGMSGFSQFAVGGQSNLSLPVTLLSFSGYKDGSRNQLSWTTGTEINNRGFDVQRSTDGVNYTSIGFVNSLAFGGNSNDRLSYRFTDNTVSGVKQYYRLRQEDLDGRSKLSNIVLINGAKPSVIALRGIFPNPAQAAASIIIDAPTASKLTLLLTDMAGRNVTQQIVTVSEGSNTVAVNIASLQSGTYLVRVINELGEVVTGKLVKE